jgi:hypothetical protein
MDDLITRIKSPDEAVSGPAWQGAAACGAAAVQPLGQLMADPEMETARGAKRALFKIVRYAGRPGAESEARAVQTALIPLLRHPKPGVRRDVLWMLSEIGGEGAVAAMAALLSDTEAREDARCALARLPAGAATAALKAAFQAAPEDFRFALADALRRRGVPVEGYRSQKLVPDRQTAVKPFQQKEK